MKRWSTDSPESALVAAAKAGDRAAFGVLAERHLPAVCGYLRSRGASSSEFEDLCQQTFLRAFLYIGSFTDGRSFVAWLLIIARNLLTDERKRNAKQQSLVEQVSETTIEGPERAVLADLGWHDRLKCLPDDLKLLLELRILKEVPIPELAEIFECSENALRIKLHRALSRLRENVQETGE